MKQFKTATDLYQISSSDEIDSILDHDYRIASLRGERVSFRGAERLLVDITVTDGSGKSATILMIGVEDHPELSVQLPSTLSGIDKKKAALFVSEIEKLLKRETRNGKLPPKFISVSDAGYLPPQKASERLMPGYAPYGTLIAHLHRYGFAKSIAERRTSHLDLGCGTGYGLAMLGCTEGMGVDISATAIDLARLQYGASGFSFQRADLDGLQLDRKYDIVTSFEVVEHLPDHHILLETAVRNMEQDGTFIVSIPNPTYHGSALNPYHLHDISPSQMVAMLETYFEEVSYYHQGHDIHGDLDLRYLVKNGLDPHGEFWLAVARKPRPGRKGAAVSIVIPVYNKLEFTVPCLASLARHKTRETGVEIIVVDNGSTDGTAEFLAQAHGNPTLWRNERNLGFAKACNQGATLAKGEFIVFLNNDTEVHPGWIDALLDELRQHPETGIVGGRLLYPDGTIQHAGVAIGRDQIPYHIHRQLPADHPLVSERRAFPIVTAACVAVRREEFYRLGMFDERYVNGHEDIDLCFRYRQRGQQAVYRPDCLVTHHESISEGRMASRPHNLTRTFRKWRYQLIQDDFRFAFPESARSITDTPLRFAVKIGTPDRTHTGWGDIYFAECLAKSLERSGHSARIHYLNEWGTDDLDIDVVIHLKGLSEYKPKPYNVNIMWMLNHPSLHTKEELERYDAVLVASVPHALVLEKELDVPVYPFLQATDPEHFRPCPEIDKQFDLVFVGNNTGADRLALRQIIADLLPTEHRLAVWGRGWEGKLPPGVLQGEFIPWEDLPKAYASSQIVLNDHQPEMKDYGFVNNRSFDATACGATVISDHVRGLEDVLAVNTYTDRRQLHDLVNRLLSDRDKSARQSEDTRRTILREFTFDRRVNDLLGILAQLTSARNRVSSLAPRARSFMTHEKPLVSVLMSTYNRKRFLPAAIESIKAQSYPHWELVLVNDGGEKVDEVVQRADDDRIRLVNLECNRGKGHAVNRAFLESKGDFIAYQDDDDIWHPDHLERLLLPLTTIPSIDMAYSAANEIWLKEQGDHVYHEVDYKLRYYRHVVFTDLIYQNFIQGIVVVHRRNLFEQVGGMDENLKALLDWDLWRRIAAVTDPYHVSRVTADRFFRESLETTGKGQITSLARADLCRYERNRLRVTKKRFPAHIENKYAVELTSARKRAKCDFLSARIARAESTGNLDKARCGYNLVTKIADEDRIGWLRRYAEFELVSGNPRDALHIYRESIDQASARNHVNFSDIMTCALLHYRSGEPRRALAVLSKLSKDAFPEKISQFIDDFRSRITASI